MANEEQLKAALVKAHEAGNAEHARVLAQAIKDGQASTARSPDGLVGKVSEFIDDAASERAFPGVAGDVVRFGAGIVKNLKDAPVQSLVDAVNAPVRATGELRQASSDLAQGDVRGAGDHLLGGATAVGETGLMVIAPGSGALVRQGGKQAAKSFVGDAASQGIDPTLAAKFPRTAGGLSKAVADNPITSFSVEGQAEKIAKQSEDAVQRAARQFSNNSSIEAVGETAKTAAKRFNTKTGDKKFRTFRDMADDLYKRAETPIDFSKSANPESARKALTAALDRFDSEELSAIFGKPVTQKILAAIEGGAELSLRDLRSMRTEIRDLRNASKIDTTPEEGVLKLLEGALTDDIYRAIEKTAGPKALRDLKRADRFYGRGIERVRGALKPFFKKDGTDEDSYRAIIAAAKNPKDGGNIKRIQTLRRALKPNEMDDIASGVIANLGKPRGGGDFSVETFTKEWKNMSPAAKKSLFGRKANPQVLSNLEKLAGVLDKQAAVEALTNRSRSGSVASSFVVGGLAFSEPLSAIALVGGASALGRLMMSPTFTRAVLNLGNGSRRATIQATNTTPTLAVLLAVEQSDDAASDLAGLLREEIMQNQSAQVLE